MKCSYFYIAILLLVTLYSPITRGENLSGKVLSHENEQGAPIFLYEKKISANKDTKDVLSSFRYADGKPAVSEKFSYKNGALVRYTYDQEQANQHGVAEILNGELFFVFHSEGKTLQEKVKLEPNTISPNDIEGFVQKNWSPILAGDSIHIQFISIERQETIGFKFYKEKFLTYKGIEAVLIKLRPTSFLFAALVEPLRLTFEKGGQHRMLEVDGRLPLKRPLTKEPKSPDDWRAIDAKLLLDASAVK